MRLTTIKAGLALAAAVLTTGQAFADSVASETAFETGAIHDAGDNGVADYYGSGNDDDFGEYGIASFNFSLSDFGFTSLTSFDEILYTLTHNERTFSDGDSVRFYYTPDDFDTSYTGLAYDNSGANDPDGVDPADFSSLIDLGVFPYTPEDGGTTTTYDLTTAFTGSAAGTSLLSEINSGSDFQLLIAAPELEDDVTYSGTGNTFDPGDPLLAIEANGATDGGVIIPEPSTGLLTGMALAICGSTATVIRRRRSA